MSEEKKPVWPLLVMLIWYAVLLAGSAMLLVIGLSFGSEAYRGAGIPFGELLPMIMPIALVVIFILSTVLLWNAGKYKIAYGLCGISLLPLLIALFGFGLYI